MKNLAYIITGDNPKDLEKHGPLSRKKIEVLGWIVLLPTFMWLVFGYLIGSQLLGSPWYVSLAIALGSASIIFVIDRTIVISQAAKQIKWFRILLALVVALIGAALIDSVILKADVDHYMEKKYDKLADERATEKTLANDSLLLVQTALRDSAYREYQKRKEEFNCEIDGNCGSGRSGVGKIAAAKKALMESARADYDSESAILDSLQKEKEVAFEEARQEYLSDIGKHTILRRITDMHEMAFSSWDGGLFYLLFLLFGLSIELLVILMKVYSTPTAYEKEMELKDKIRQDHLMNMQQASDYYQQLGHLGRKASNTAEMKLRHPLLGREN